MQEQVSKIRWYDIAVALIALAVTGWISVGFWFPDSRASYGDVGLYRLTALWACRLLVPVTGVALIALYLGFRKGKVPVMGVVVLGISLIVGTSIFYPIATHIYFAQTPEGKLKKFHPYLQVAPNSIEHRPIDGSVEPFRVYCIGGSTTEYADEKGRTWPSMVEARLNEPVGERPIEFYNCGREWYTSQHGLIQYLFHVRPLQPDLVILLHGINDVFVNVDFGIFSKGPFEDDYGHYTGAVARLVNRRTFAQASTHFFRSLWYYPSRETVTQDSFPGLNSFARNLNTMIELCREDSIPVVLMTQPNRYRLGMSDAEVAQLAMFNEQRASDSMEWTLENMELACRQYNDQVRTIGSETGTLVIDLEQRIPKTGEYFFDEVHFKGVAMDTIATVISEQLVSSGLLEPLVDQLSTEE